MSVAEVCSVMGIRLVSGSELHFNAFEDVSKPNPASVFVVLSIQVCTVAVIVPPAGPVVLCTVVCAVSIVVPVVC